MNGIQSAAALTMRAMITAGHRARMIQIAARLGIADILARGPADSLHLAAESGCNADALGRLLRALAASGAFRQTPDGAWQPTELGETLCADSSASCRAAALYWGLDSIRSAWDHLEHSIRTGQPAFDRANGRGFFDHMAAESQDGNLFDGFIKRNQNGRAAIHAATIATAADFVTSWARTSGWQDGCRRRQLLPPDPAGRRCLYSGIDSA
jgi:hypothetical protein